jgi:teichuronic acid biosynthesis glycosyltransferase TuaC
VLRVLTLSTLFPDASRPNFGVFVERQTVALAARDGVEVTMVAPRGVPPGLGLLPRYRALTRVPARETWEGLATHRPRFAAWPAMGGRHHAAALERALRPVLAPMRGKVDVIDASFFFPDGPAAVALGRWLGVPVSIKARGADIHHWGRAPATAAQVLVAGQAADGMLAVSGAMRDDMVALGMPAERIAVHRTGIDHGRFRPVPKPLGRDPHIVSLGALIPRKGHDIVIEAVARLPGVRLTVVGEGPERARLQALIERLGVAERVTLAGAVAHADMPALLGGAHAMALASASEGLANAWVEALACGTPIVITDVGGAREVVTGSSAGRIVDRTADAFTAGLSAVLGERPAPDTVAAHAAGFSWEANAAALHAHLQALVDARGGQAFRG